MNMKAILMSTQSKWLYEILNGRKTVELRKRFPKDFRGWMNLYCTKGKPYLLRLFGRYFITDYLAPEVKDDGLVKNGKVVARVWVDDVVIIPYDDIDDAGLLPLQSSLCLSSKEIMDYANNSPSLTVICFSKLEIFDKPKELGEFSVERYAEMPNGVFPCYEPLTKAPQSWQYVEVEK